MVDKKTMRKRVKQFFKKLKSPSQNRGRTETKFMQIQKSILRNQFKYQSVTNLEEVFYYLIFSCIQLFVNEIFISVIY